MSIFNDPTHCVRRIRRMGGEEILVVHGSASPRKIWAIVTRRSATAEKPDRLPMPRTRITVCNDDKHGIEPSGISDPPCRVRLPYPGAKSVPVEMTVYADTSPQTVNDQGMISYELE